VSANATLGRNFWLYHVGQMISTVGDACGNIALTWWILDVTRSPAAISAVLAPAMAAQMFLTPILGPLGDRMPRLRLILLADMMRGAAIGVLGWMAMGGLFSIPVVIGVYSLFTSGSALFNSNNMSIVPQLVSEDALHGAVRTSQSLQAIGRVLGGVIGGLLVSIAGVGAAFLADAVSFGVAALLTAAIGSGALGWQSNAGDRDRSFISELGDGFRVIQRVPLLLWLCGAIALFNLILSPMQVLLPTYAKVTKGMPAWFFGGLEASLGAGIIAGALLIGRVERAAHIIPSVALGLILLGSGTILLPHLPGIVAPMASMFVVGLGAGCTNIPIGMRMSVAIPNQFRSRINSIIAFIFDASAPVGLALGGLLVPTLGVTWTMTALGLAILLAIPVLFQVKEFAEFFRRRPDDLSDHFLKTHPDVFTRGGASSR
jgi:MFS transporter, DHA3 family, macrolide efflux protein